MARCRLRKPVSTCVSSQTVVVQGPCFRKGRLRNRCQVRTCFIPLHFFCTSWPTVFAHFFDFCECFTLFKDEATIFPEKYDFAVFFAQGVCDAQKVFVAKNGGLGRNKQNLRYAMQRRSGFSFGFDANQQFFVKKQSKLCELPLLRNHKKRCVFL